MSIDLRQLDPNWSALGISFQVGSGVPTYSASKGSIYINLTGGANTRMYINADGATTWGAVTSA